MEPFKIFLTKIEYNNALEPAEYLYKEYLINNDKGITEEIYYNPDGSISQRFIENNEEDYLLSEDRDNHHKTKITYFYNDAGELVKEIETDENDEIISRTIFEPNKDQRTEIQDYNSDEIHDVTIFHYDENGNQILIERFVNNEPRGTTKILYDDNKQTTLDYDCSEKINQRFVRYYDEKKNILTESVYDNKDFLIYSSFNYYEGIDKNILSIKIDFTSNEIYETLSDYNFENILTKDTVKYYVNFSLVREEIYRYQYLS